MMTPNNASTPEPPPQPGLEIVYPRILTDIIARVEAGRAKYGTPLQTFNGRDSLNDAYQETLDLLMYLKQQMMERGALDKAIKEVLMRGQNLKHAMPGLGIRNPALYSESAQLPGNTPVELVSIWLTWKAINELGELIDKRE